MKQWLRSIPPVHELQTHEQFVTLMETSNLDFYELSQQLKEVVEQIRCSILSGEWKGSVPGTDSFIGELFQLLANKIGTQYSFTLERVINATGTILHTNLGRARLSDHAVAHVIETAQNYSNLEYKLEEGKRGSRHSHVESLIKHLTGAEAAMIVNNNAAAVYLVLRALVQDKEVIVSRGQLVEIGGSFRISAIMDESGAKLVEVGTTNKTHLNDYQQAVSEQTAMIMKVHTSNFKVIGFTETVDTKELISLKRKREQIIFYEDLGSGALYDFRTHGIGDEPVVREVIEMGADLVTFSGDKLLGGPQAGIIAGKQELIDRLKNHQLARVVRVDKMTLAALEGTLIDYAKGERGLKAIPVVRDILKPLDQLEERARRFAARLTETAANIHVRVIPGTSKIGGGTMPEVELPSVVVALQHNHYTAGQLAKTLRAETKPAIVARIQKEEFILDLRTVSEEDEEILLNALKQL